MFCRVTTKNACFGVEVNDKGIIQNSSFAAPIAKKYIGQTVRMFYKWDAKIVIIEETRLTMDINKRLEVLVDLNMLKHTRENEMIIGNHLIAVREYIEKQTAVLTELSKASREAYRLNSLHTPEWDALWASIEKVEAENG